MAADKQTLYISIATKSTSMSLNTAECLGVGIYASLGLDTFLLKESWYMVEQPKLVDIDDIDNVDNIVNANGVGPLTQIEPPNGIDDDKTYVPKAMAAMSAMSTMSTKTTSKPIALAALPANSVGDEKIEGAKTILGPHNFNKLMYEKYWKDKQDLMRYIETKSSNPKNNWTLISEIISAFSNEYPPDKFNCVLIFNCMAIDFGLLDRGMSKSIWNIFAAGEREFRMIDLASLIESKSRNEIAKILDFVDSLFPNDDHVDTEAERAFYMYGNIMSNIK
jgi:hypothetical protein